ncbi:hypothetical protein TNCV_3256951 [Trichonephila clavipes]|nr:hypothetical protein TNCV_3256951 [Trichonephila clavipes]
MQLSGYKGYRRASENSTVGFVLQNWCDLSDVQKGRIIGFGAKGGSISETAKFVNCSRATVVKAYLACLNGTDCPKSAMWQMWCIKGRI